MARLSQVQLETILRQAPEGTSREGIMAALRAEGHSFEEVPTPQQPTMSNQEQGGGGFMDRAKSLIQSEPVQQGIKAKNIASYIAGGVTGGLPGLVAAYVGNHPIESAQMAADTVRNTGKTVVQMTAQNPAVTEAVGVLSGEGARDKIQRPLDVPFLGEVKPLSADPRDTESGNAQGPGETAIQAGSMYLEAGMPGASKLFSKLGPKLASTAERIYRGVLKPTDKLAKAGVVKTGLEEAIPITERGAKRVDNLIESLNTQVDDLIATASKEGKKVDLNEIDDYVGELRDFYSNSIGGDEMVKELDDFTKKSMKALRKQYGRYIPVDKAQEIKKSTYGVVQRFYNKLSPSVTAETKKQLARGMKEEIAKQVPEVQGLNAREKKLIDFSQAIDKATNRLSKKDLITLGDAMVFTAEQASGVGAQAGLGNFPVIGLLYKLASAPGVRSNLAIQLNKASKIAGKELMKGSTALPVAVSKLWDLFNKYEQNQNRDTENDLIEPFLDKPGSDQENQ